MIGLPLVFAAAAAAAPVAVCREGKAALPVVVGPSAGARTRRAAEDLASSLGRICGKAPALETGDGSKGLALGLAADFPSLPGAPRPEEGKEERFVLRSRPGSLLALGATEAGVEAAESELLYRLGWRQFFPGPDWEIVPKRPELSLDVDLDTTPSYLARRIWYGTGLSPYNQEAYARWAARNRVPGAFELNTGHALSRTLERRPEVFKEHPEYLGLVSGKRTSDKYCLSNPALRRVLVEDALARLAEKPGRRSVSLEPSDGDGWCECAACAAMGTPSDRLNVLASEVSAELEKRPDGWAGFYAYHTHSAPPSGEVRPRVIVSVATAYQEKGWTPAALMRAWSAKGARLGVREYYGVHKWHRGLPARMRGGDVDYVARTIPEFHGLGARYFSAESGEDWGAHGLGHYVASRLLWDVNEASRVAELREDFLERAFGAAKEPMRRYYELAGSETLDGKRTPRALVEKLWAALGEAERLAADPGARRRILGLALYVRYVELYEDYEASILGRGEKFAEAVRHARRMKGRMLVHLRELTEWVPTRDRRASAPPEDGAPEFTDEEAAAILHKAAGKGR